MSYISIPEEGINHPNFEKLEKDECIDMMFSFAYYLDEDATSLLSKLLDLWINKTNWKEAEGKPVFISEVQENIFHLALANVKFPQKALRMLAFELQRVPLGLESVFFLARKIDQSGKMLEVIQEPKAALQEIYSDNKEWWSASFNFDQAPPISEQVEKILITTHEGNSKLLEKRGMRLHLNDCRIVYGTANSYIVSPSKYCWSIASYLTKLLGTYFNNSSAILLNTYGKSDHVDLLMYEGRQGYGFQIEPSQLMVNYPKTFRFKEYELMLLLREAIQHLYLSPVIHWTRGEYYEINLWEPWLYDM